MKPVYASFVIVAALILMWACAASDYGKNQPADTVSIRLTADNYLPIKKGMTPDEVIQVVGAKPTDKLEQNKFMMLVWEESDKSAIRVRFNDGKVIQAECTADISDRILH